MAKTIAQLHTEAQTIENETIQGANTATRVGGLFDDIVDFLDEIDYMKVNLTASNYTDRRINNLGESIANENPNGLRVVAIFPIANLVGWTIDFRCYNNYANAYSWAVWQGNTTVSLTGLSQNTDTRIMSAATTAAGEVTDSFTVQQGDKYLAMVWYDQSGKRIYEAVAKKVLSAQVIKNTEDIAKMPYSDFLVGKDNWSSISKTASHYIKADDGTNGGNNNWGGTGNYYVTGYIDVSGINTLEYRLPMNSSVSAAMLAAYKDDYTYDSTNSVLRSSVGVSQGVWTRATTTKYIRLTIYYAKGASVFYVFEPDKVGNILYWLRNDIDALNNFAGNNIVALNKDRETIISNLGGAATTLRLLHFSDLHQDPANMQRIMDWANAHFGEVDDILNTGDTVNTKYSGTITGYGSVSGVESILYTIGNHDIDNTGSGSYTHSGVDGYNTYIAPNVGNWGVTQPSNAAQDGKCYYYKDYSTQGIRLIVLDTIVAYTSSSDERTWFQSVLADAITNSLAVVVACHWIDTTIVPFKQHFTQWSDFSVSANNDSSLVLADVQDFIGNGGEFICYLIGHSHADVVGVPTGFPEQLCIMVGSANGLPPSNNYHVNHLGGEVRVTGTRSQDSFNLVGINTTQKCVTVVKIGVECNVYGQRKDYVRVNYSTKEEVWSAYGAKEDKCEIVEITTSTNTITAEVGKYYRLGFNVGTLAVTLPTIYDKTKIVGVMFGFTTDSTTAVTFAAADGSAIATFDGFQIDPSKTYEINAIYNGAQWVLGMAVIV